MALGCTVPLVYRETLRKEDYLTRYESSDLEKLLLIPSELVGQLLDKSFEADFETALLHCDKE